MRYRYVAFGLFAAVGLFLLFFSVLDGPAPDDSAIVPTRPSRPIISPTATAAQSEFLRLLTLYRGWQNEPAQLEIRTQLLAAYDALLEHDLEQVTWPDGLTQKIEDDVTRYPLAELRSLMHLLTRRIADARQTGEPQKATLEALKLCRLGHSLQTAPSSCKVPSFGIMLQNTGLTELQQILTSPSAAEYCLEASLRTLSMLQGPSRETMQFLILDEYWAAKSIVHDADERLDSLSMCNVPREYFNFKANRALKLAIAELAPLHDAMGHDWATAYEQTVFRSQPGVEVVRHFSRWYLLHRKLRNNQGGEAFAGRCGGRARDQICEAVEMMSKTRIACVMLAIRLHQLKKGQLPEKLGQLIPEYRNVVPTDPLSDTRYLWDRESETVSSADGISFNEIYWWHQST